jgi:c(7)-type cytochrome triheme protein
MPGCRRGGDGDARRAAAEAAATAPRPMRLLAKAVLVACVALAAPPVLHAEYGDVVLNKHSDKEGVRPVVFPHWFHRIRYRCKVCHQELGFKMRAGANEVLMSDIIDGKFCGMCHNNTIAWGPERCDLCHSGLPGTASGIVGGAQTSGPGRW